MTQTAEAQSRVGAQHRDLALLGAVRKSFSGGRVDEVDVGLPKSGRAEGAECDSPALPPASSCAGAAGSPHGFPLLAGKVVFSEQRAGNRSHVFKLSGWKLEAAAEKRCQWPKLTRNGFLC